VRMLKVGTWLMLLSLCASIFGASFSNHTYLYGVVIPEGVNTQLLPSMLEGAGATCARIVVRWADVESVKGFYNWRTIDEIMRVLEEEKKIPVCVTITTAPLWSSRPTKEVMSLFIKRDYKPFLSNLPPKDPKDFAKFIREFVHRYKRTVRFYEIWDEPDGVGGPIIARDSRGKVYDILLQGSPAQYLELLKTAHREIKIFDRGARIALGGLSQTSDVEFLNSIYELGGGRYFDAVALHPYGGLWDLKWRWIEQIRQLMVEQGDERKEIWLTSWGWSSDMEDKLGVPEKHRAYLIGKIFSKVQQYPYITQMYYTALCDWREGKEVINMGLYEVDGKTPKSSLDAFASASKAPQIYMRAQLPDRIFAGVPFQLKVRVINETAMTYTLTEKNISLELPDGWKKEFQTSFPVQIKGKGETEIVASVTPPSEDFGKKNLETILTLLKDGKEIRYLKFYLTPRDPLQVSFENARLLVEDGKCPPLVVRVKNLAPVNIECALTISGPVEENKQTVIVQGLGEECIKFDKIKLPARAGNFPAKLVVEEKVKGMEGVRREYEFGVSVVANCRKWGAYPLEKAIAIDGNLSEWQMREFVDLMDSQDWQRRSDISARLRLAWDDENFYIAVKVLDDKHYQPYRATDIWRADSIQFGFDSLFNAEWGVEGFRLDDLEYGIALNNGGDVVFYRYTGIANLPSGHVEDAHVAVVREGDMTTYEIALPWRLVNIKPQDVRAGRILGFSLLLNENDGDKRDMLEWGSGIGSGKKPYLFVPIKLTEDKVSLSLPKPRIYKVKKIPTGAIYVDGKIENIWSKAEWQGEFTPLSDIMKEPVENQTQVKILWDDDNLYVLAKCLDSDIWATKREFDDSLWEEEVFETYIDSDGDGQDYLEFEVNPLNTVIDLKLPEAWFAHWKYARLWNCKGFKTAVTVVGTLNDRDDRDKYWIVEEAIPFTSIGVKPAVGSQWRVQFYRIDRSHGKEEFSSWSPSRSFHIPYEFGILEFVGGDDR